MNKNKVVIQSITMKEQVRSTVI